MGPPCSPFQGHRWLLVLGALMGSLCDPSLHQPLGRSHLAAFGPHVGGCEEDSSSTMPGNSVLHQCSYSEPVFLSFGLATKWYRYCLRIWDGFSPPVTCRDRPEVCVCCHQKHKDLNFLWQ